jgi:hypothetical protein
MVIAEIAIKDSIVIKRHLPTAKKHFTLLMCTLRNILLIHVIGK